ncbi:MAG: mechanosensitive ion channel family protein [Rhodothermales bacterium]
MSARPLRQLRLSLVFVLVFGVAFGVAYTLAGAPAISEVRSLRWLFAGFLAALGVFSVQVIRFFVLDVVFLRAQGHRAPALVHVVVAMVLYFVLGLLIAGGVFGQSLTGAIATSAAASVVLGLALQDTLGNFFAGIALQIEKPFRLDDVLRTDGMEGRIESFNWRTTTIRTTDNARIIIPNSVMAREPLEVFARSQRNRRIVPIPAPYGAPPRHIIGLIRSTVAAVPGVAERPAPRVRIGAFDASSITYDVLYWVEDYMEVAEIDSQVRERVWYVFARNGITIPFPHIELLYDRDGHSTKALDAAEEQVRERDEQLGRVALLAPLTDEERGRLAEQARTLLFGPGEQLIQAGREGGSMFVVLRGRIEIRVPDSDGRPLALAEVGPGEVLGEMALLTGEPRSADAWALDEVEVIEVRRAEMRRVLANNEALAEALAHQVSVRQEQNTKAFARTDGEPAETTEAVSLLRKIRHFFDLA